MYYMDSTQPSAGEIWAVLKVYEGVPEWWCSVFESLQLSLEEAEAYVTTSLHDKSSLLSQVADAALNATLRTYAESRGVNLLGSGAAEALEKPWIERSQYSVSTVCGPVEREEIVKEVSGYADVKFKDKVKGTYSQHAVANGVRGVHESALWRTPSANSRVLMLGASVKAMVNFGVDPDIAHGCCPVLDVRDGVRHSVAGFLHGVLREGANYTPACRKAALAALDENSGYLCRNKAEDCTWPAEHILSNESTHDIAFDKLPVIMARHGARVWTGFATRATGWGSGVKSGYNRVLGAKWKLDEKCNKIKFHFFKDGSFGYEHDLSQWRKYEELTTYRWRGKYYDYVYSRLPATTAASLAFTVVRVPKVGECLAEPTYGPTGLAGKVLVKSVRAKVGVHDGSAQEVEPFEFVMDRLAFDKVFEYRMSIGSKGMLSDTMAYMRSMRVRFYVNGVALGVEQSVCASVLESAGVAIEVLAYDARSGSERDYDAIRHAMSKKTVVTRLSAWMASVVATAASPVRSSLFGLLNMVSRTSEIKVSVEPCPAYVLVSGGQDGYVESTELSMTGCGCGDLKDVRAALVNAHGLSASELYDLQAYEQHLLSVVDCNCYEPDLEAEVYEDTVQQQTSTSTTVCGTDSCVEEKKQGFVTSAVREFASWAQYKDECVRTEAAVDCSVLFLNGSPTMAELERYNTPRTKHVLVVVKNGKLTEVIGKLSEDDETLSELYVRSLQRTVKVKQGRGESMYIDEPITELCYASSHMRIMNGDVLARAALTAIAEVPVDFSFGALKFVNGVPGSGKTYEICKLMRAAMDRGESVLYLAESTESAAEAYRNAFLSNPMYMRYARTFDSFLMHGVEPMCGETTVHLFLDEVPMAHAGKVFAAMLKAKALNVHMYGDFFQIPFIPFTDGIKIEYSSVASCVEQELRCITHRFGEKTCAMWLDVYGEIYPCSCCEHEDVMPNVVNVKSATEIPDGISRLLTFTQEEKTTVRREKGLLGTAKELRRKEKGGLSTVHEDQGGTHLTVGLTRLVARKNPKESILSPSIYNRQPWVLVATTRHKVSMTYYTTAGEDLVTARVAVAGCPVRLQAVKDKKHWKDVARYAMVVPVFGV